MEATLRPRSICVLEMLGKKIQFNLVVSKEGYPPILNYFNCKVQYIFVHIKPALSITKIIFFTNVVELNLG